MEKAANSWSPVNDCKARWVHSLLDGQSVPETNVVITKGKRKMNLSIEIDSEIVNENGYRQAVAILPCMNRLRGCVRQATDTRRNARYNWQMGNRRIERASTKLVQLR